MKHLPLQTTYYQKYIKDYRWYLQTLGYSASSVYNLPNYLQEFFYWLEQNGRYSLDQLRQPEVEAFFVHLQTRNHQRQQVETCLSVAHLNKYVQALRVFMQYRQKVEEKNFPFVISRFEEGEKHIKVLSREDINALFSACKPDVQGFRDRALLSVFYGAGLRRNEGVQLDLKDVGWRQKTLLVRHPKNGHQRYVPLSPQLCGYLLTYVEEARPASTSSALFLSAMGQRLSGQSMLLRLKALAKRAELPQKFGLHTLRHSIATHLLEQGMPLKQIALFLGHRSLESTQRYTHLPIETHGL